MTMTEAAACGTPAVATRIAGHADAVRDGRLGPPRRPRPRQPRRRDGRRCSATRRCAPGSATGPSSGRVSSRGRTRRRSSCGWSPTRWRGAARADEEPVSPGWRRRSASGGRSWPPSPRRPARPGGHGPARPRPDRPAGPGAEPAAPAARRPGARGLRAPAAHPAGLGQRRHQDLPLPRPVQADEPGVVDVGPVDRPRHGHPPERRLPVADGPLLLGARHSSACPTGPRSASGGARSSSPPAPASCTCCARWAGATGPASRAPPSSTRSRRTCSRSSPGCRRSCCRSWPCRGSSRSRSARPAPKGWRYPALFALVVATCGSVNATALLLVGVAPGAVAGPRGVGGPRDLAAHRRAGRPAHRRRDGPAVGLVDHRPVGAGHERHRDPALHRDRPHRGRGVGQPRGAARARLLVLLRRRPPRPVDRAERRLHPVPAAAWRSRT